MYLQIGWSDEKVFDAWPKMPQQFIFNFQRKIKDAFDPNSSRRPQLSVAARRLGPRRGK